MIQFILGDVTLWSEDSRTVCLLIYSLFCAPWSGQITRQMMEGRHGGAAIALSKAYPHAEIW
jgi:hypothetical protein